MNSKLNLYHQKAKCDHTCMSFVYLAKVEGHFFVFYEFTKISKVIVFTGVYQVRVCVYNIKSP